MGRIVAIVEDEPTIRDNYTDVLTRQGYEVKGFADRHSALADFDAGLPDLVVIDVGLGDDVEGGFDLCRDLRSRSSTLPIIFLTARDSDFDVISGLRLGADDYLTKDISLPHFVARVVALFRRQDAISQPAQEEQMLVRGSLRLDAERLRAQWLGHTVALTVTEFWIVHSLARYPGHVKNRDQLMEEASVVVDDNTITSHIKRIRKKFAVHDNSFDCIETVYGMGYRWVQDGAS